MFTLIFLRQFYISKASKTRNLSI